jgi:hypothetical protein
VTPFVPSFDRYTGISMKVKSFDRWSMAGARRPYLLNGSLLIEIRGFDESKPTPNNLTPFVPSFDRYPGIR